MEERENFETLWADMPSERRNVIVSSYLKSIPKWDLKRILCDVLGVDSYMDDGQLGERFNELIYTR